MKLRGRRVLVAMYYLMIALGLSTLMSCSGVSSNSFGHPSNGTGSGTTSGTSQFLYTANQASNTISGFQINNDGTLTALADSPFTAASPASSLSVANSSLLLGGCNPDGNCGLSLYSIASQSGILNPASSVSTSGSFSAVLDPSAGSVYATGGTQSTPNGTVSGFSITGGSFSPLPGSPYVFSISNGSNPVTSGPIALDPSGKFLYMGSITPQNEHTPAGSFGMALRNNDGSLSGFTTATGCITAGSVAVAAESGSSIVYASCVDDWSGMYWIASLIVDSSTGNPTSATGFVSPDSNELLLGLAVDPSGKWLAVTDVNNNLVHVMSINPATGALSDSPDHIFPTGTAPNAVAFDHTGKFLYVTNGGYRFSGLTGSNNISGFTFDSSNGMLTPLPGSPYAVGQAPSAIAVAQP
ncbi:MAG TPA: hypothetical protein VFA90_13090 [Terriglobales bacterium]|nr:hypothetical protein [Terriglobales bacterium]